VTQRLVRRLAALNGQPWNASELGRSLGLNYQTVVIEHGRERWAVEIKLTTSPSPGDLARLEKCAAMIGASRAILVSRTPADAGDGRRLSCGLDRLLRELGRLR
jgi:hypothetical protein